jgi:hypothetical protein
MGSLKSLCSQRDISVFLFSLISIIHFSHGLLKHYRTFTPGRRNAQFMRYRRMPSSGTVLKEPYNNSSADIAIESEMSGL